ncbi:hypothetical protein K437DRAFT_253746 [Tilletiaria anomala UBC 951]|uniref:Cytochrome b561 domain-containing protein n=1 Tax=Tilletiaria anomala (strain ATCC 24038 / CBS 436.72 / UBC 951) TaxID=1037660 RepID=A0A066WP67_TILAU|nr:uncharacterized protein K437DRAFT_253746 [Tilletiaria anomala UBC 951]KDN52814.1 hypothetical protein K437DRAFT_253746 [Tilletiaria anomala UBC 951]
MGSGDDSRTPLLQTAHQPAAASVDQLDQGSTMAEVYKRRNLGSSARLAQAVVFAFVALIWSLIFTKLPFPLPLFGYHPLIQSLALISLVQSVLVLQPTNTPQAKAIGLSVHQTLNLLLMLPLFTAGAGIMYYLHGQPGTKHFISWHGTLGFTVVVLAWLQAALGAASVWFNGAALGGERPAKAAWKWHRLSGYVLLLLFHLTFALAVWETTWGKQNASTIYHVAAVALLLALGVTIFSRLRPSKLPKLA